MSKITASSLPGWAIARPRLDYLLGAGTNAPLTVVTGPPGTGKSMSIALWTAACTDSGTVAWITLDEYDNRPQAFWSYVEPVSSTASGPTSRESCAISTRLK